jgi:hypothetical protein
MNEYHDVPSEEFKDLSDAIGAAIEYALRHPENSRKVRVIRNRGCGLCRLTLVSPAGEDGMNEEVYRIP